MQVQPISITILSSKSNRARGAVIDYGFRPKCRTLEDGAFTKCVREALYEEGRFGIISYRNKSRFQYSPYPEPPGEFCISGVEG